MHYWVLTTRNDSGLWHLCRVDKWRQDPTQYVYRDALLVRSQTRIKGVLMLPCPQDGTRSDHVRQQPVCILR